MVNNLTSIEPNYFNILRTGFVLQFLRAFFIFLIGFILGKLSKKLTEKILEELEVNKIFKKIANVSIDIKGGLSNSVSYIIYTISFLTALAQFKIAHVVLYILSGILSLLLLTFIFLSLKDYIPNIIAGIYVHRRNLLEAGKKIEFKNISGEIKKITLSNIQLENENGDIIIVPNKELMNSKIKLKKN